MLVLTRCFWEVRNPKMDIWYIQSLMLVISELHNCSSEQALLEKLSFRWESCCCHLCVRGRQDCDGTHVWGCKGSSPRETHSPWISLKHFSQKWYLSARSPYFGELHRSPSAQPITERARRSSRQSGQGRTGQGAHTQEEAEGKVGRRQEEAANRDAGFLCGRVFWFCAQILEWMIGHTKTGQCRHHKR